MKAELDTARVDRPAPLHCDCVGDETKIGAGGPVLAFGRLGKGDAKISPQPFLQRLIGRNLLIAESQFEDPTLGVADKGGGKQNERRLAQHVGFVVLVPLQEPEREKEDVDAALPFGRLGVMVNGPQSLVQDLGRKGRLQSDSTLISLSRRRQTSNFGSCLLLWAASLRGGEAQRLAFARETAEQRIRINAKDLQGAAALRPARGVNEAIARAGLDELQSRLGEELLEMNIAGIAWIVLSGSLDRRDLAHISNPPLLNGFVMAFFEEPSNRHIQSVRD